MPKTEIIVSLSLADLVLAGHDYVLAKETTVRSMLQSN